MTSADGFSLSVNGRSRLVVDAVAGESLLFVLRERLGDTVDVHVSTLVTDPWSHALAPAPRRTP